jgi:hypothetical protein
VHVGNEPGAAVDTTDSDIGSASAVEPRSANTRPRADEAKAREEMRQQETEEIEAIYSLLLEDLGLSPRETEDLTALLIEMAVDRRWDSYRRGRGEDNVPAPISDQERAARIEAVIGNDKLQQFLALERKGQAYYETYQIASLLRRRDAPLTVKQREGVFDIVAEVRGRYDMGLPPSDIDTESVEYIERILLRYDELDRHVIALAPSVLSPNQVVLLFEQYQRMSRQRYDYVERYKKLKAERPGEFRGWVFTPGSWHY